jgi:hypothetical protein
VGLFQLAEAYLQKKKNYVQVLSKVNPFSYQDIVQGKNDVATQFERFDMTIDWLDQTCQIIDVLGMDVTRDFRYFCCGLDKTSKINLLHRVGSCFTFWKMSKDDAIDTVSVSTSILKSMSAMLQSWTTYGSRLISNFKYLVVTIMSCHLINDQITSAEHCPMNIEHNIDKK